MWDYIKNKRKIEKVVGCLSIAFWILNFTFSQVCINMFLKIITVEKSYWFESSLKYELTTDPFILQRTELLVGLMILIMIIIIFFSLLSVVLFRNMQLKNSIAEQGIYRVLGYNKKEMLDICMIEPIADMVVALPISLLTSTITWNLLSKNKEVSFMMQMMNNSIWLDISSYVMVAGVMVLVTVIHTKIFLERSLKKGIRYMLGQGVE